MNLPAPFSRTDRLASSHLLARVPARTGCTTLRWARENGDAMATQLEKQQPPANGQGPWWLAAAGGGGGVVAAILQDHALGWVLVVAFTVWLIHNIVIAWISK